MNASGKIRVLLVHKHSSVQKIFHEDKEKGAKVNLLPFFFVRFLLDSAAILY